MPSIRKDIYKRRAAPRSLCLLAGCLLFLMSPAQNRDSIGLTLDEAENIFLSKNLSVLAAKYEGDAVKAGEIQAKLFDNPNFYFEQSIYNQYSKRYFPTATRYND